jgi:hypothetical protein
MSSITHHFSVVAMASDVNVWALTFVLPCPATHPSRCRYVCPCAATCIHTDASQTQEDISSLNWFIYSFMRRYPKLKNIAHHTLPKPLPTSQHRFELPPYASHMKKLDTNKKGKESKVWTNVWFMCCSHFPSHYPNYYRYIREPNYLQQGKSGEC